MAISQVRANQINLQLKYISIKRQQQEQFMVKLGPVLAFCRGSYGINLLQERNGTLEK